MKFNRNFSFVMAFMATLMTGGYSSTGVAAPLNIASKPLFLGETAPPLLMLVLGRNHKLYYEAYNDASDLNNDGILDVGYKPSIDYYGYFNSYACYDYSSSNGRFVPKSVKSEAERAAGIKTCNSGGGGSAEYQGAWSGDFLNYVTTARIDALRKVFYGGYRSTDTATETVLERTHIPQDAHAWAKEYRSPAIDGYYINEVTPLALPATDTGHLFGNVSESDTAAPLLKVLTNVTYRPWEWASIEGPVVGDKCVAGVDGSRKNCVSSADGDTTWELASDSLFENLTLNYYDVEDHRNSPENAAQFDSMVNKYERNKYKIDPKNVSLDRIQGGLGNRDHYLSVVKGTLTIPESRDYIFSVNGDDAVEFLIEKGGNVAHRISWYGGHSTCDSDDCRSDHTYDSVEKKDKIYLLKGDYQIEFRHHEFQGGDSFSLYQGLSTQGSALQEYEVRSEVCKSAGLLEDNCKVYSDGSGSTSYKPTGLLHDYGENDSILFGLLTGSYASNLDGGVLRKVVSSFKDEVNSSDGTFATKNGIVGTIDKLKTVGFSSTGYKYSCGWKVTGPISNGECEMWGNPIAEMMYETVRYFKGKKSATPEFKINASGTSDAALGLPNPDWNDPYDETVEGGQPYCANPYMMVVSDINPSYDSDKLPGSAFSTFSGDVTGLNVSALANTITDNEPDVKGLHYIGQSGVGGTAVSDNAPSAKQVNSLSTIRGLAPEEPTKMGSYYSAAVSYYGWLNDLFPNKGAESKPTRINTFAVALASPLPRITIPFGDNESITLVPFAKSPGGNVSGQNVSGKKGDFQPTNTIVDFYVESISATEGSFRINFEDVEQGADHDMDAIARYSYKLSADKSEVTIKVDSLYAAGSIDQHMGYVISGTDGKDGIYLVVRDISGGAPLYYLDTPAGVDPGDDRGTDKLTLNSTRTFKPGKNTTAATLLKDPLYYAAKWGGFTDKNDNNVPDLEDEWDAQNNATKADSPDGVPDNYFLVTNALALKDQLSSAFDVITDKEASSSTVTVNSGELNTDSLLFQATFNAQDWTGDVVAYPISTGSVGTPAWNLSSLINAQVGGALGFDINRNVITYNGTNGVSFRWPSNPDSTNSTELSAAQVNALRGGVTDDPNAYGNAVLNYIRGDQSEEGASSDLSLRARKSVLGDIANSDPLFVDQPGFFYPDNWPGSAPEDSVPYSSFRTALKNRQPVLYFGANDGMFHAINAYENDPAATPAVTGEGKELLAYVPSMLYGRLGDLANTNYTHQSYVDGPSTYGDVFFSGDSRWHTALVGTLRGGGQGLFALDITDPKGVSGLGYPTFSEASAGELVLWEFSDADDADLGYTFGKPVIVRLQNGKWGAVFSNGYNNTANDGNVSATGNAVLYIVDVETGALIRKLDTGVGMVDDPLTTGRPNGLAAPAVVDLDGDYVADAVYAGDLFGNMWKFDISGSSTATWKVVTGADTNPKPLFVSKDANGNRLPITSAPAVGSHPDSSVGAGDVLVYFGTGKYFENTDNDPTGQNTQSFFSIWDKGSTAGVWDTGSANADRSNLLQQSILAEASVGEYNYRLVSEETIRWRPDYEADGVTVKEDADGNPLNAHTGWFIDLLNTQDGNTNNFGERVIYEPIIRNDRIIFTTLIPSMDVCAAGGSGWLMEMSAISGGRLPDSPFDVNNDGNFDENDLVDYGDEGNEESGGWQKEGGGIPTKPAISDDPTSCEDGQCSEKKFIGTSTGVIETVTESSAAAAQGRQSWREVN